LAFLTMETIENWTVDIDLSFPYLKNLDWDVEAVDWRSDSPNWQEFDAVYIGVPWDYPTEPDRFMQVLESIDRSPATLFNDISLVCWTLAKTYLRDLEEGGAAIVPSLWFDDMNVSHVSLAFEKFATDQIIVKPIVSTNATDTYLLTRKLCAELSSELLRKFRKRPFVVQPFMDRIKTDGEYSLFYFDRSFSHAIQKIPKQGDFRVQEEYGAQILSIEPNSDLLAAGHRAITLVDPSPVYARIDFVQNDADEYLLMELELIEPSMYLRTNTLAPERFAHAIDLHVIEQQTGERE